jgi:hypothetical protein
VSASSPGEYGLNLVQITTKTVTLDVLSELFGIENDCDVIQTISWAISNALYEQIVLYYGLEHLRSRLLYRESRRLTVKRGDVLEAYMAGIVMDVSQEAGEGYQEIRTWFYSLMRLRMKEYCPRHLKYDQIIDFSVNNSLGPASKCLGKETTQGIEWIYPMLTKKQLTSFWLQLKIQLDSINVLLSAENFIPWCSLADNEQVRL